jgi:hypothetical protein
MKNTFLQFIAIAAMHVAGIYAAQAQTPAGPNRPATVPPGYVITPFGYFHPSCAVQLAQGDKLEPDQHVIRHANGQTSPMPACAYPHYTPKGEAVDGGKEGAKEFINGWIESASVSTTSSYSLLSATWSVPMPPTSNDGQTLFYFPGLEDSAAQTTYILQPVLGWNKDFPSAWSIASWHCCPSGIVVEATPAKVSPGDTIYGVMMCTSGLPSCTSWDVYTVDLQNGNSSMLFNTSSLGQTFNWAFAGVLEAYNIKQCTDFPGSGGGTISFHDILLNDNLGQQIANPNWSVNPASGTLTPQCNYSVTLPTQVTLQALP